MKKKRKFYRNVVNHIYQKAVKGFNLFYSDEDRLVFYTIFAVCARSAPEVVSMGLCLMYDHFHILAVSEHVSYLSRFMQHCTSWYVREFNEHIGRQGALFRKNYGSAPKWGNKKVHSAIAYHFNNPVEKLLCKKAEDYRWSFLPYAFNPHPFSERIVLKEASDSLKKACMEVNSRVKLNIPLNYPQLKRMRRKLSASEWEQLVDYIIHKYFPFDMESLLSYYESYDNMLLAVNSNTGGEYDLKEDFLPFSDLPYAEMIACICERVEPADVSKIVMMTPEEKKELFIELKRRTSADERQIRKFLHMDEGGQQLVDTDEDT